ncbi:competence/damage-inducible protein A [Pelotalea chapellei]|uniref:CinA-like protein n=1 Tax=Pelotalea chapellei TaxID=44671 RepID=A0ABS5U9I0_9BACT|nr:competence/damage-inducible protein A [Pelotalea chapellei]MBT1072324.1 competence/damage-inducible protein A [Pelotalea chapellei]
MRISTLSIGDELITGQIVDSNAAAIAAALLDKGLRVQRHLTVGDNELDIIAALEDLAHISDAIIATGGLGPTADDLTTHAVARATARRLILNEEASSHIRNMSGKLASLVVCPLNDKQALIPSKTTLIHNPTGTACGFHLMHNGCFMFFLPGVPGEMRPMLAETVIPFLEERVSRKRGICTDVFNLFGTCEAEVDQLLSGVARPEAGLQMSICVTYPAMRITLRAEGDSRETAQALLKPAVQAVRQRVGEFIFSVGDETLGETVASLFRQQGLTLALAESCTGGMISASITAEPGSSAYFLEGAVTYSNSAKTSRLDVESTLLVENGAVSSEVASAMAKGMREAAGSDLALSVTGIAGPEGGTEEKPVGTVYISLAAPDGCWTKRFQFGGSREEIRTITTWTALDWLRRYLLMRGQSKNQ